MLHVTFVESNILHIACTLKSTILCVLFNILHFRFFKHLIELRFFKINFVLFEINFIFRYIFTIFYTISFIKTAFKALLCLYYKRTKLQL